MSRYSPTPEEKTEQGWALLQDEASPVKSLAGGLQSGGEKDERVLSRAWSKGQWE